jgi:hypothetical protein
VTAGCGRAHSVSAVDEFAYFMIRVRRKAGKGAEDDPLTGVIERLGSGEKSGFVGPDELVAVMTRWTAPLKDDQSTSTRESS